MHNNALLQRFLKQNSKKNTHQELATGQYMTAVSSAYAQRLVMTLCVV